MFLTEKWIFVDSITFSSPWEDLRSVWEGEGGEKSLQLKGTGSEGDKKFDSFSGFSPICPRDATNIIPFTIYFTFTQPRAIWVEGVWKFHADKGF